MVQKNKSYANRGTLKKRRASRFSANEYFNREDGVTEIYTGFKGELKTILIDTEDLPKITGFNSSGSPIYWSCDCGGVKDNTRLYAKSSSYEVGKSVRMHRIITDAKKGEVVDHINHDTLDNRKANLRIVTPAENSMNRKGRTAKNKSGVRNVYWCKGRERYVVHIRKNGKLHSFGRYKSLEEASKAAEKGREVLFGEFGGGDK